MNIWLAIGTGALTSAIVNVIANVFMKRWEHRREDWKERDKKRLVYLEIAIQLEDFAARAFVELEHIINTLSEARAVGDQRLFDKLNSITFDFNPAPDWNKVPITIASKAMGLQRAFDRSLQFVITAGNYSSDSEDIWEYEAERVAFYGRNAIHLAASLKSEIGVRPERFIETTLPHFDGYIKERRKFYDKSPGYGMVIPELVEEFQREDREHSQAP